MIWICLWTITIIHHINDTILYNNNIFYDECDAFNQYVQRGPYTMFVEEI